MAGFGRARVEYASTRMQGRGISRIPVWQALLDDGDRTIKRPVRLTSGQHGIIAVMIALIAMPSNLD